MIATRVLQVFLVLGTLLLTAGCVADWRRDRWRP